MSKIKDAHAYNNRGVAYARQGMYEEAIKEYTRAIELDPQNAVSYYNRALASRRLNRDESAIRDLNKYIALNPKDDDGYYERGRAYANLNKHDKAIEDFNKVIERDSDFPEAYISRGYSKKQLEKDETPLDPEVAKELAKEVPKGGRDLSGFSQKQKKELAEALQKKALAHCGYDSTDGRAAMAEDIIEWEEKDE